MWSIIVTDLFGNQIDEVYEAQERVFTFGLNRIPTVQFKIRSNHPLALALMSTDVYVKVYMGTTLVFHGIPTAVERVADRNTKSMVVTASGALWRLTKRLAAKSSTGTIYTTATDRGTIARAVIDATNSENNTGIRTGTLAYTSGSTTTFKVEPYKPVSEVISELGLALDGFDWEVVPIEYTAGKVGDWHAQPVIGQTKTEAIFEYGDGRNNISSINDQISLDTMANQIYHISPQGPDAPAAPVVSSSDGSSIAARGLYEDIASGDLTFLGLRQSLVEEHVRLRRFPRRVVSFNPRPYNRSSQQFNVPKFITDYTVGDTVFAAAREDDLEWFNGYFRVYQATINVDRSGMENVTLVLTDEG